MEFRLLFEGLVRPTGNKGHPGNTHAIRKMFHPQLRHLWQSRPSLRHLAEHWSLKLPEAIPTGYSSIDETLRISYGYKAMGNNWDRAGFSCIPLVVRDLDAT